MILNRTGVLLRIHLGHGAYVSTNSFLKAWPRASSISITGEPVYKCGFSGPGPDLLDQNLYLIRSQVVSEHLQVGEALLNSRIS